MTSILKQRKKSQRAINQQPRTKKHSPLMTHARANAPQISLQKTLGILLEGRSRYCAQQRTFQLKCPNKQWFELSTALARAME